MLPARYHARPALRIAPAPSPKAAPPLACVACRGHGFRRTFDADGGWFFSRCPACRGVSTRGRFALRVVTRKFRIEFSNELKRHSDDFAWAVARAERAALHLIERGGVAMGQIVREVNVVYYTGDPEMNNEVVHASGVLAFAAGL